MEENKFNILKVRYLNEQHTAANLILSKTLSDGSTCECLYTFVIDEPEENDTWKTLKQMYDNGEFPEDKTEALRLQLQNRVTEKQIRSQRDKLLEATDKYVLEDYPISAEHKLEVKAYRQALRDITKQAEFPENVIWPTRPEFI
jgi:DNA mismatch repair ATPase MutS